MNFYFTNRSEISQYPSPTKRKFFSDGLIYKIALGIYESIVKTTDAGHIITTNPYKFHEIGHSYIL